VQVDSYRFLPRSFVPLYADAQPLPDEGDPVWTEFTKRLADARIAVITSAGLHLEGEQAPFDADRERREPTWGDPSHRVLPADVTTSALGMTHLHVNPADILADHNVALPTDLLAALAGDGVIAGQTSSHVSVMGYQQAGLDVWRRETAPAITSLLRDEGADGVVLAPV
jgi:D-proline reductase (dithiol) PrdB